MPRGPVRDTSRPRGKRHMVTALAGCHAIATGAQFHTLVIEKSDSDRDTVISLFQSIPSRSMFTTGFSLFRSVRKSELPKPQPVYAEHPTQVGCAQRRWSLQPQTECCAELRFSRIAHVLCFRTAQKMMHSPSSS